MLTRRDLLKTTGSLAICGIAAPALAQPASPTASEKGLDVTPTPKPLFTISLAQWSLHRALYEGRLAHVDFPKAAKHDYDIDAVEYVCGFWKDRANPMPEARELKKRCQDLGVASLLIMCDGEGALGAADPGKRRQAAENHYKWLDATKHLGGHSIRVNLEGEGTPEEHAKRGSEGLGILAEHAATLELNVIVENHGGNSSNGAWLAGVMRSVNHPRCGTLPDFGNFTEYDRYQGITELMPFAKAVSAKSYDFDEKGNETKIDYARMLGLVLAAGYHGRVGVEYEGSRLPEPEGVRATKRLLERVCEEIAAPKKK